MKKMVLIVSLFFLACMAVCPAAIAMVVVEEWLYYGDYAYQARDGKATIVGCYSGHGMGWDDEESGLEDRPGQSDDMATFQSFFDEIWYTAVPSSLGGYPVTAIGDYGMAESNVTDVILPEGITSIGDGAFAMCEYTLAITVPESVTFIGEYAFNDQCNATLRVARGSYAAEYAEANGIPYTYDPNYKVFESENWLYTVSGDTATVRGYEAYDDWEAYYQQVGFGHEGDYENPMDLEIPAQLGGKPVTAIKFHGDPYSFSGYTPLIVVDETIYSSIIIPDTVTIIEGNSLSGIFFSNIIVSPSNPVYESVDGVLFDKQQKMLVAYPGARTGAYQIPEGTTSIGEGAFSGCKRTSGVSIPLGVTEIGDYAFYWCKELTDVELPSGVTSIGEYALAGCGFSDIAIPDSITSIGYRAFSNCEKLTSISIPGSVTSIGASAFTNCSDLNSVIIPDSVTSIGYAAFYNCFSLTSITIPAGVTDIDGNPFMRSGIKEVVVASGNPMYATVDGVLFDKQQKKLLAYPSGRIGEYIVPEGTESISDGAFYWCEGLTGVKIPGSVTRIGDRAFFFCSRLASVNIPYSVTSIGKEAFYACGKLTRIDIPSSITSIEEEAFASCNGLTRVHIPDSVTSIGDRAFYGCDRLSSVVIPSSVTTIGESAFDYIFENTLFFVAAGSYAEQYVKEQGMDYTYIP